ncbi:tetratricopeptide repeat protein 19, mitochondrial isoform X3 [Bos indicus x Bos taurus]|uniref:tetratricopeptide repeat protein 19, mitochondrial isoform X3 n=1 Tax=Bos indicus x Bos taurus TaxID=30522 RepID=UPI000F7D14ED|nr:tetratricopeptide repeat protein 19, mitochondrial isoform X3 [Bos indicus x Bos taurus]
MYRLLAVGLARGLLRVAGRRGRCHPVCLLPGPPGARAPPCRGAPRGRGSGLVPLLAALAWSSRPAAAEQERRGAGGAAAGDAEAEIIQLLKRAKFCIMKDEPEEAELILHDALHLAHKSHNTKAIAYTYDLEDNAIIEISLKLATIYAAQSRQELALAGYEFCISTLEEKIERERELSEDVLSADDKANTQLLLGMCLDTYARYLLFSQQPSQAQRMYEKALRISEEILGERHPQTIVLLNDLATTLDTQGRTDEACVHAQRASDLARQVEHPELHVLLSNLAAVLTHRELYAQAEETYREALRQAELKRDEASVQHIREELAELARKSRPLS